MSDLKQKVEAILFATGKKATYEELSRLCDSDISGIKQALHELKKDYEEALQAGLSNLKIRGARNKAIKARK